MCPKQPEDAKRKMASRAMVCLSLEAGEEMLTLDTHLRALLFLGMLVNTFG